MPPKKRTNVQVEIPEASSRRRSTRLSSTGQKNSYFESHDDDVDDSAEDEQPRPKRAHVGTGKSGSSSRSRTMARVDVSDDEDDQYEEIDEDEASGSDDDVEEEEYAENSATPPPSRKRTSAPSSTAAKGRRGRPPKEASSSTPSRSQAGGRLNKAGSIPTTSATKKRGRPAKVGDDASTPTAKRKKPADRDVDEDEDDEDEDEDEDEDDDDDDEPQVTFIPLPQLRDTNGVEYEDTKVHPNTLHFLGDLKRNNKRSWLKMHDPEYRRSLKDWESFVETLTDKIIEADETIPELPLKDVIFRIYRDIRFSKDPTPYKPHYSAAWSRTGRKGPYACYYVHVEPGHCFVGGGLWHPEAAALARLRASVDERPHRIRRVLTDPEFVRVFLPDAVGKKEDKVLKAFADKNRENALKTKPKGFNPEHRDIHLLKLRNYTVGTQIPDEDLSADDAQEKIIQVVRAMVPFVTFLNNVVMPDPGVDSDSEEEEEEEEQDGED